MASFKVEGGHRLKGEITPQGAKNEALQILCAVLLTSEKVTIHKIPNIRDVNKLIELVELRTDYQQPVSKGEVQAKPASDESKTDSPY